jgi:hypothetical protein
MRRSSKKLPEDPNQLAAEIVRISTEEAEPSDTIKSYLASIGRKGGLKGGKIRARKLSPKQRQHIASLGGKARAKSLKKIVAKQNSSQEN